MGPKCSAIRFVLKALANFLNHRREIQLTHWDTINLAMMEELEETGLFDEVDLRAWQRLVAQINDAMFVGYLQARELITMSEQQLSGECEKDERNDTEKQTDLCGRRSRTYE